MPNSSFFLAYHHWNALLCVPAGFVLNFLLLWLILRRTPKDMWVHSRVLLQTCILDILVLIVLAMGGHVVSMLQPWGGIVLFQGYFIDLYQKQWSDQQREKGLQFLMLAIFGIYQLDMQSISAQFLYRYLCLNHDIKIGLGRYLLLLLPPLLVNLILTCTIPLLSSFNRNELLEREMLSSIGLVDQEQKPVYIALVAKNESHFLLWTLCYVFSQTFFYAIIAFCGIRMVRFVSAHAMTERLKELNRQLSRNLIIMATVPLFVEVTFTIFYMALIYTSSGLVLDAQMLSGALIYWLTVLNPLISIWTFRPYRKALGKMFCCNFKIVPIVN